MSTERGWAVGGGGFLLIAFLWFMPWPLASNRIWIQDLEWLPVGLLALVSVGRLGWRGPWLGVPVGMRLHFGLLLAWSGFLFLQWGSGSSWDPYSTLADGYRSGLLLLLQWLLLIHFGTRRRLEVLIWAWLLAGGVEAVLGVILFATGSSYSAFFVEVPQGYRAKGSFVYHNHFAGYLEMMLALGMGWMLALLGEEPGVRQRGRWLTLLYGVLRFLGSSKVLLRILLVILVIGLIASRSRMGNAAFFAALWLVGGATLWALRGEGGAGRGSGFSRVLALFMVSILVLDGVIIGGVVGIDKVIDRIEATHLHTVAVNPPGQGAALSPAAAAAVAEREESVEQRIGPGLRALRMLRDAPWLGTGGGTFHLAYFAYKSPDVVSYYDHAHDDYIEFGVESGGVGSALLVLLLGWSQWRGWKLLLGSDSRRFERGMAFASVMGVTELLIHSTVDFNLQNPTNATLFLWLLGLPHWVMARRVRRALRPVSLTEKAL